MGIYSNYITEADLINPGFMENLSGSLFTRINLNWETKEFDIQGINFNKFIARLREMYKYKGIENLFEKHFSAWSTFLWKKKMIHKSDMTITNLTVPLFFALEIYRIFLDLGEFYKLPYYQKTANNIFNKTWISNYTKKANTKTDTSILAKSFNYTLKDYQLEFVEKYSSYKSIYDLEGIILSFEQGLGKTLTAIAIAECLRKDQVIIICPNSLKENWAYEIKSYFKKYNNNDKAWREDVYITRSAKFSNNKNPRFIITNQESINLLSKVVKRNMNSIIIVDESHNFRNIDSKRSKELIKLKETLQCKDNLMMSGTPIKATPEEIIPALRMIDPYFTEEMAILYKKSFNQYSAEISRVVKERFGRVIYRKTKSDVLNLPKKNLEVLKLPIKNPVPYLLETVRAQIQDEFKIEMAKKLAESGKLKVDFESLVWKYSSANRSETKEFLDWVYKSSPVSNSKIEVHELDEERYKAFLSNYVYPNTDINTAKIIQSLYSKYLYMKNSAYGIAIGRILPPAKTNCYTDIFEENKSHFINSIKKNPKKTVIFTQFLQVANYISDQLSKEGIGNVKIVGSTKDRMSLIQQFKEDDVTDVLVATVQTLSTGVTLTEANQMFFFGTPYRDADFQQACDRIHRIGQTSDVNIYTVLLDSGHKENITDRINEIMNWSGTATSAFIEQFIEW